MRNGRPHASIDNVGGLLCLAVAGTIAVLVGSRWGIGLSPDSCFYVGMARHVLDGHGLSFLAADGTLRAVTDFPPLFPLTLAGLGLFGVDPLDGARLLNAALFAINILLAGGVVVFRLGSWRAGLAAAAVVLTSTALIEVHSMAWSEPLFIVWEMAALLTMVVYLERRDRRFLMAASVASGFAFLTRYGGMAVVATGLLACVCAGSRTWKERWRDTLVFAAWTAIPMAVWLARNVRAGTLARGEILSFHPPAFDLYWGALLTFSRWFVPDTAPYALRAVVMLAVAGFAVRAMALLKARDWPAFPSIFVVFGALHVLMYWLNDVFVATNWLDDRAAAPIFIPALIVVAWTVTELTRDAPGRRFEWAMRGVILTLVVLGSARSALWIGAAYDEGLWFTSRAWRESETIRSLAAVPDGTPVYSNAPDAIYILTGRATRALPLKKNPLQMVDGVGLNDRFRAEMSALAAELRRERGIVAYFDNVPWRDSYIPRRAELVGTLLLKLLAETGDGSSYTLVD